MSEREIDTAEDGKVRILPPRHTETRASCGLQSIEGVSAPKVRQVFTGNDFMVEELKIKVLKTLLNRIKINDCGRNIRSRWYVDYYLYNPDEKVYVRNRAYGFINKEKDPEIRYSLLLDLEKEIREQLNKDFRESNPYYNKNKAVQSVSFYLGEYLKEKKKTLRKTSYKTSSTTPKYFYKFLQKKNCLDKQPILISKELVKEFKGGLSGTISNRTVNNHMEYLSAFFNYMINNYDDVLFKNPCRGLDKLPSRSEKHVRYTTEQTIIITEHLQEQNVNLLNFIHFVGHGFLRPNEIMNLRICDIDWHNKTITLPAIHAKTGKRKTKKLMQVFFDHLVKMELQNYNSEFYIFTIRGVPGPKRVYDNYFGRQFRKHVKKKFNLSKLHTIYGFRHTFVSELLQNGAPHFEIMKYTGHETLEAFQVYAQDIIDLPAEDLSKFISTKMIT